MQDKIEFTATIRSPMKIPSLLTLSAIACATLAAPRTAFCADSSQAAVETKTASAEENPKDAGAEYELSKKYLKGKGVQQNLQKAFGLMKSAADQGYAEAMGGLGYFYASGIHVEKNESEAVTWFRKGAEAGDPKSQLNLGQMLAQGHGTAKDEKEGLLWITRSAEQNLPEAEFALGAVYYFGRYGLERDYEKAFPYLLKAAEAGNPDAQNMVGFMLEGGTPGIEPDLEKAEAWFRKAAENGNAKAQANLGALLNPENKDAAKRIEALTWLFVAESQAEATSAKVLEDALAKANADDVKEAKRKATLFIVSRSSKSER
jgi:TPR repeat protein